MTDYIERNLAKAEFTGNFRDDYPVSLIRALIDTVPAADVRPVVRGEWIEQEDHLNGNLYYECSACRMAYALVEGTPAENEYHFCPHCGADMRGEND